MPYARRDVRERKSPLRRSGETGFLFRNVSAEISADRLQDGGGADDGGTASCGLPDADDGGVRDEVRDRHE